MCGGVYEEEFEDVRTFDCRVTRFEVIDEEGRAYVKYLNEDQRVCFSLQDNDLTLKVFVKNE